MRSLHFLYHELRPAKSRYSYVTPCEEFGTHCELFARLRGGGTENAFRPEVTFDDGHASDFTFARSILERHGLSATFFITAGWTGQRTGFMTWPQLRDLHAAGHRIGAHGMTHKLLTGCSAAELEVELQGARKRLEDGLGAAILTMSLPGGRANSRVFRACAEAGYKQIFTSVPRAESMREDPTIVGRLNLLGGTSVEWLERALDPGSGALLKLERVSRLKYAAKGMLGDRLYARLWAMGNRQEPETPEVGGTASEIPDSGASGL